MLECKECNILSSQSCGDYVIDTLVRDAHTNIQIHVHIPSYKTTHTAGMLYWSGTCTHTNIQVHVHIPAYKTAHMAGTPVSDVHTHTHTHIHVHNPAYKTAHTAGTQLRDVHTHTHMYTALPTRLHIRQVRRSGTRTYTNTQVHYTSLPTRPHIRQVCYAGQGRAHTQTYKCMYTSLPTRPHIWQVRRSATSTHTRTHIHVHNPAYKTAHAAGTPVRDVHTHTHTSLPTRPHIRQVRRSGTRTYTNQVHVHIPAYKTTHTAGTPVRDAHTQTYKFTPLVFSAAGGMGSAATVTYRRLASLLATKRSQPYSRTMGWIRCRISFSLLRSAVTCLRGARSTMGHPLGPRISDTNLDLATSEGKVPSY